MLSITAKDVAYSTYRQIVSTFKYNQLDKMDAIRFFKQCSDKKTWDIFNLYTLYLLKYAGGIPADVIEVTSMEDAFDIYCETLCDYFLLGVSKKQAY